MGKLKSKSVETVNCFDFDKLVVETYGRPYMFQQQDGCKGRGTEAFSVPSSYTDDYEATSIPEVINGSEMGVSFDAWLLRDPKEWNGKGDSERFVDMFWERNFYPNFEMVVNDLHEKGLIDEGEYVMDIDW